jgi:hypothetical protein
MKGARQPVAILGFRFHIDSIGSILSIRINTIQLINLSFTFDKAYP